LEREFQDKTFLLRPLAKKLGTREGEEITLCFLLNKKDLIDGIFKFLLNPKNTTYIYISKKEMRPRA
jgi:hypothetical protein